MVFSKEDGGRWGGQYWEGCCCCPKTRGTSGISQSSSTSERFPFCPQDQVPFVGAQEATPRQLFFSRSCHNGTTFLPFLSPRPSTQTRARSKHCVSRCSILQERRGGGGMEPSSSRFRPQRWRGPWDSQRWLSRCRGMVRPRPKLFCEFCSTMQKALASQKGNPSPYVFSSPACTSLESSFSRTRPTVRKRKKEESPL